MPDWTYSTTSGSTWGNTEEDGFYVTIPYFAQQMWEKEQERRIKEKEKAEELREDKRKYPLFYWRELTDGDS